MYFIFYLLYHILNQGLHGGAVVTVVASQQELSGLEPHDRLGPVFVEFVLPVAAWVSFGHCRFLPQ